MEEVRGGWRRSGEDEVGWGDWRRPGEDEENGGGWGG